MRRGFWRWLLFILESLGFLKVQYFSAVFIKPLTIVRLEKASLTARYPIHKHPLAGRLNTPTHPTGEPCFSAMKNPSGLKYGGEVSLFTRSGVSVSKFL